jgi:hypothetical protein
VLIEAAVGVVLIWRAPLLPNLIGLLVVLAEGALVGGLLWRLTGPIAWSMVLLGAAFGLSLIGERQGFDAISLLVAAALFLAAEVAYLGIEVTIFSSSPIRPLLASLAVAIGSVVTGVLLLAIGDSLSAADPILTAGGVAASLVLIGLLIAAAARRAHLGGRQA